MDPNLNNTNNQTQEQPVMQQSFAQQIVQQPVQPQGQPKKEKKESKVAVFFGSVLLIGIALFLIISAVVDLVKLGSTKTLPSDYTTPPVKGEYLDATFHIGGEAGTMKHTINFIPVGKEYYYIVFNDDMSQLTFVRADKHWGENFDANTGLASGDVKIKGRVREMDYKIKKELSGDINYLVGSGIDMATTDDGDYLYIDALTSKVAILKLSIFGCFIIAAIFGFLLAKVPEDMPGMMSNQKKRSVYGVAIAVFAIAGIVILLHVISTYM